MKIKVYKENEDIITKLIKNNKEISFDYVSLINGLYEKDLIDEIDFADDIDDWEQEEIKKLIEDINNTINSADDIESEEKSESNGLNAEELDF